MLTATEIAGFAGAGLARGSLRTADLPPDQGPLLGWHQRLAFEAWLLASVLTTARAIAIGAGVFSVLGGIQIVATTVIMVCAIRYKDTPCPVHLADPRPRWPRGRVSRETGQVPGIHPAGRQHPHRAMLVGRGGHQLGQVALSGGRKPIAHQRARFTVDADQRCCAAGLIEQVPDLAKIADAVLAQQRVHVRGGQAGPGKFTILDLASGDKDPGADGQ